MSKSEELKKELEKILPEVDSENVKFLINRLSQLKGEDFESLAQGIIPHLKKIDRDLISGKTSEQVLTGLFQQDNWTANYVLQSTGQNINIFLDNNLPEKENVISIPILLLAMNQEEKEGMLSGSVFDDKKQEQVFQECELILKNPDGKSEFYGKSFLDWRPCFRKNQTDQNIREIIEQYLNKLNQDFSKKLMPQYIDIRSINNSQQRSFLLNLRSKGCIVIIDVLSLFCPNLLKEFHISGLEYFDKNSIVTIFPNDDILDHSEKIRINLSLQLKQMEFQKKKQDEYDYGSVDEIDDFIKFKKWFSTRVKDLFSEDYSKDTPLGHKYAR